MKRDFAILAGVIVLTLWVMFVAAYVLPALYPLGLQ